MNFDTKQTLNFTWPYHKINFVLYSLEVSIKMSICGAVCFCLWSTFTGSVFPLNAYTPMGKIDSCLGPDCPNMSMKIAIFESRYRKTVIFIDREAGEIIRLVASVRPSVRPSVDALTFEPFDL